MRPGTVVLIAALTAAGCGRADDAIVAQLGGEKRVRLDPVRRVGNYQCGEAAIRAADGHYHGYRRFVRDVAANHIYLDPGPGAPLPATAEPAACAQREAYRSAFDRFECARRGEQAEAAADAATFGALWPRICA